MAKVLDDANPDNVFNACFMLMCADVKEVPVSLLMVSFLHDAKFRNKVNIHGLMRDVAVIHARFKAAKSKDVRISQRAEEAIVLMDRELADEQGFSLPTPLAAGLRSAAQLRQSDGTSPLKVQLRFHKSFSNTS